MPIDPRRGLGMFRMDAQLTPVKQLNVREQDLFEALHLANRIAYLTLLAQNVIAGRFVAPVRGDAISTTNRFISLFKNTASNPVAVTVSATFSGVPGKQIKLSLSGSNATSEIIDYLGNTAAAPSFNKRISTPIILKPSQEVFINTADTAFALIVTDVFAVRLMDPAELLADANWESK